MKYQILTYTALISLCAVSCSKLQTTGGPSPEGKQEMVFSVSSSDVKTTLSEGKSILWEKADSISIFDCEGNGNRFNAESISEDGKTAVFRGTAAQSDEYVAIYPWHFSYEAISATQFKTVLPPDQFAVKNSFGRGANLSFAVSSNSGGGKTFYFRQVGAFLSFSFSGCQSVTSIRLKAASGEKIAGSIVIDRNPSDGSFSAVASGNGSSVSEIVLFPTPGKQYIEPGSYQFVFLPASFSKGVNLFFTSGSGADEKVCKVSSSAFTATRNSVSRFTSEIVLPSEESSFWHRQKTIRLASRDLRHLLDKEAGKFVWPITNFTEHSSSSEFYDAVLESGDTIKIMSSNKSFKKSDSSRKGYFALTGTSYPYTFRILFPPLKGLQITRMEYYSASDPIQIFFRPCTTDQYARAAEGTVAADGRNIASKYIWNSLPFGMEEGCIIRDTTSKKSEVSIAPGFSALCATYSDNVPAYHNFSILTGRDW